MQLHVLSVQEVNLRLELEDVVAYWSRDCHCDGRWLISHAAYLT